MKCVVVIVPLAFVAFACGSLGSDAPSGSNDAFGSSSGSSGTTCVPDEAGVGPRASELHALGDPCPPGTHPAPGSTNDGSSSGGGSSGGTSGGSSGSSGSVDAGPPPVLCKAGGVNNEPKILVGYAPASGQTVGATGQIKVWVNDEGAPIIAPGEIVDPTTGAITSPGDRTAKAADGYLWEPALYIAPETAESGGTPHFPTAIKGSYNNTTIKGAGSLVAGMDPPPPGSVLADRYTGEDIWNVSSLGLGPGTYFAEFVIHDGDRDRGVGCVTIVIAP